MSGNVEFCYESNNTLCLGASKPIPDISDNLKTHLLPRFASSSSPDIEFYGGWQL